MKIMSLKVSIPHSYSKNRYEKKIRWIWYNVSIPHSYSKNESGKVKKYAQSTFQSLIVILKTSREGLRSSIRILVSIPHSYSKNDRQARFSSW